MFATRVDSDLLYDRLDAPFYNPEFLTVQKKLNQYKLTTLESVSYTIFDPPHIAPEFTEQSPYQMIMIENLTDNGIEGDFRYITENCHLNMFRISHLEGHELLMTRVGATSGTVGVVTERHKGLNASGNLSIIKIDSEKVDRFFIFVYFNSNIGKKIIKQQIANTARDYLTIERIKSLPIPIIPKYIQTYIGNKVRKAEELREEAKRLKKEAKDILEKELGVNIVNVNQENTQKYTWVACESIDDRIDAGFYSAKYKVLDAIKKKHEIIFMSEIINGIYTGNTPSSDYNSNDNDGVPLIAVNNVKPNLIEMADNIRKVARKDNLLLTEENDMVITRVGSVGVCAIIEEYEKGLAVSDNVIIVKLKERIPIRYLSFYLNSVTGVLQVERMVKGAVQPVINYQSINKFFIPILSSESMIAIDEKLKKYKLNLRNARRLIEEAKQDVEDLIEGKFDESKISEGV